MPSIFLSSVKRTSVLISVLSSLAISQPASAKYDVAAPLWRSVLESHVKLKGPGSVVDYAGLKSNSKDLDDYVREVQAVSAEEFAALSREDRIAFLVNAYNAFSVKMVIENYPIKSFSGIGGVFANPWRKKTEFKLFGIAVALDDIETKMIDGGAESFGPGTGGFNEARTHYAVCKMAKDAPRLLNEPYLGSKLADQLKTAAQVFITDRLKNGYTEKTNSFEVSQVFRWYRADFEKAPGAGGSLANYLAQNFELDPPLSAESVKKATVKFVNFDWALNDDPKKQALKK